MLDLLRDFGLEDFYLELSTMPEEKAVGTLEEWEEATEALREAALAMDLELVLDPGGGAFYGPKISVQARDAIGRTWQISTIQVDIQLPQRFDMDYVGQDNTRHRPIMIHRALFGSVERFFAVLVEHYAGRFRPGCRLSRPGCCPYATTTRLTRTGARRPGCGRGPGRGGRRRRAPGREDPPREVGEGALYPRCRRLDVAAGTVGVNARGSDEPERGVGLDAFVEKLRAEAVAPVGRGHGGGAGEP